MIEHRLPVAVAEGVDHHTVVLQQQRDGTILGAMTWRRDVGAAAAIIEVAAKRLDDRPQGHGARPPSALILKPSLGMGMCLRLL